MTLTEKRRSKDLSLGELARAVNLGSVVMSRIERGIERPPGSVLYEIGKVLGWSEAEVLESLPSPEEVAQSQSQLEKFSTCFMAVNLEAKRLGLGKGKSGAGNIKCPVCTGDIRFQVSSHNGHVMARCSTENCVSWME